MPLYHLFLTLIGFARDYPARSLLVALAIWFPPVLYFCKRPSRPVLAYVISLGVIVGIIVLCGSQITMARYVLSDTFSDHVEPSVLCIAWQWGSGHAMYQSFDEAERTSLLYGPDLFILERAALSILGPSGQSGKFPGALLIVLSLLLLFRLCQSETSTGIALGSVVYCVLALSMLSGIWMTSAFWTRSEPYLIFFSTLGLFAARLRKGIWAIVLFGIAAGAVVNFKLYAPGLLIPTAYLFVRRHHVVKLLISLAVAAMVAVAPFTLSNVSWNHFLALLRLIGHYPTVWSYGPFYLVIGVIVCLPIGAIYGMAISRTHLSRVALRDDVTFLVVTVLAVMIAFVPAMKFGSGIYTFLPFAPLLSFTFGRSWQRLNPGWNGFRSADVPYMTCLAAAGLVMMSKWMIDQRELYESVKNNKARSTQIIADVKEVERDNPGEMLSMGYGHEDGDLSFYRTLLIFDGKPYPFDVVSVAGARIAGLSTSPASLEYLKSGRTDLWLIPRDEKPFSLLTGNSTSYPRVFDEAFSTTFTSCYKIIGHSQYFDLWKFNPPAVK